jgi:hypothetical protein
VTASDPAPPRIYALIDLARVPQVFAHVDWLARHDRARCLFEGPLDESLRQVSPYIIDILQARELFDHWQGNGADQSWGVFLETPLSMLHARRHVRGFLQVRLADGAGPVMMRFWDPRVIRPLLDFADADHHAQLFGKPVAYWVEHRGAGFDIYSAGSERVARRAGSWNDLRNAVIRSL